MTLVGGSGDVLLDRAAWAGITEGPIRSVAQANLGANMWHCASASPTTLTKKVSRSSFGLVATIPGSEHGHEA
jgi:hypothetical protein